jgi:Pyridoxamine 5'-phosphate oxidase
MSNLKQQPLPDIVKPFYKKEGIKIKTYKSPESFQKVLVKFIARNQVLHLCTSKKDKPRATPLGYMSQGLTGLILSEGGGKFNNLKENKHVSFSIAEAYDVKKDFFGDKGLQAWGKAKVYSLRQNPEPFREALRKMNIKKGARPLRPEDLPSVFHYRIIEITPDKIRYRNAREGIFNATWKKN